MMNLKLEAPWYSFQKKVKALFEQDPDFKVGEIIEPNDGKLNYAFDIEVRNHQKFLALDRVLPKVKTFGREAVDQTGTPHGFVRFRPQVVQFFDDNIADFNGNWTGLAQDIATEVFASECRGIHFCTADVRETED